MKKALFFAGLAAASLALVGCNKEADLAPNATPFQVSLGFDETRTVTTDGINTVWAEGDKINVFHAEAGTTDYKNDTPYSDGAGHPYTVSDTENGTFSGTLMGGNLEEGKSYDWYFLYPYTSYFTSPANTDQKAYVYIGGRSDRTQTQNGYDNRTHLAGGTSAACFPLYGLAKNVPAGTQPSAAMKHIASAICVNVTNGTSAAIKIDEIDFIAPEEIVGNFYVSFDKEPITMTPYTAQASATAALKVNNATDLAAGSTAAFYLGIKPFTAMANDKLTIKVKVGETVFEKEYKLPSAVEFKPGHVKTINVSYTGGEQMQGSTLEEILAKAKGEEVLTQEVLVVGKYARGIMLGQNGTYLLAFNNAGVDATIGDIVTVSGKVDEYSGLKQISTPVVTVISSGNEVVLPDPKVLAGLDEYSSDKIELIQYTGTLKVSTSGSNTYYNVEVTGSTRKGSIQYPLDAEAMAALKDKAVTATGFFTGISGSSTKYVNMMSTSVVEPVINMFDVTPEQVTVEASATSTEITVTGNVEWTAEASEGATIDKTSGTGNDVITVSFPANTDTEHEKNYSVAVRTEAEGVNDEFVVDITQAKADASGMTTATVDFSAQNYENGFEMPATTINGVSFAFDKGDNKNGPKYYTTGAAVRLYGGNSMTVSVEGKTMTSISFTFDSGEGTNAITSDVPTYAEPTWTGEAGSVTFTIGGTTGHRRIKTVTVKYKDGGASGPVTPSLTVSPTDVTVEKGETQTITVNTNSDGAKSWTTSDATVATVADGVVTGVNAGTATITLSIASTENYKAATATIPVTVTESVVGGTTLSMTMTEYVAAHGCTVSAGNNATMYKVLQLNESVRMSTTGEDNCGSFWGDNREWRLYQNKQGNVIISVADGCELQSVKLTFGTTNNGILQDATGATVASGTAYTVSGQSVTYTVGNSNSGTNGQVRITAVEVVYTGNGTFPDTPEPPTEITTTITMASSKSVYIGETVELGATSNVEGATITYESEDPTIATVNASGVVTGVAEGTVKVHARIAAVPGEYTAADRYCNVTVSKKPEQTDNADLFIFSELGYANGAEVTTVSGANVTLLFGKGEGSYDPKYYDSGTNVRMYSKNTLTISSAKTIKKVEFNCTSGYSINDATTFSTGTCTNDVWEGSAKSIEIVNGSTSQIRFVSIKVTYE